MSRGGNRGGWSLTKLRSGQEDLSTAQAIGPSGSLSTAQATRPSGRLVTDQAGLEPERLVTDQAPVSGKLDDAAMTSRITPSGCSTIRPPGPRPTSATRTPSPSTSPTVTSRYSRRRRRGCGITRVSGDNAAAGQGAVFRESESSDWFGAATGVAAMKSITDGGRRYEVHRRARFQAGETRRGSSAKTIESLVTIDEVGTEASTLGATATADLIAASGAPRLRATPPAISITGRGASSEALAFCAGWPCARSSP